MPAQRSAHGALLILGVAVLAGCGTEHDAAAPVPSATPAPAYVPRADGPLPARIGTLTRDAEAPGDADVCQGMTADSEPVAAELARVREVTGLSDEFFATCSGCHGLDGRGRGLYPDLTQSEAAFDEVIRSGRGKMPAFSADVYPVTALESDLEQLRAAAGREPVPLPDVREAPLRAPAPIDEASYLELVRPGLVAWREPGERGACAACHGPDGIDLARIGYTRGDILRRAIDQGRTPEHASAIADMIEAHRRWHGIERPCSATLFRPFQPAGSALSGTGAAADRALLDALERAGVDLAAPAADLEAARGVLKALAELDVSSLPIAPTLSRHSSDAFHAESDRTTSEWIPEIALEPPDAEVEARWLDATNRYLETPDDSALFRLYDLVAELSAARFVTGGIGERLSREKLRSLLLLEHALRRGTRALPVPLGEDPHGRFPIWEAAQIAGAMTRGCAETSDAGPLLPCWNYPPEFYAKMGTDRATLMTDVRSFVATWLVTGWLVDPALQLTEDGDARLAHLDQALLDAAGWGTPSEDATRFLPAHHLYFGLTRLVKAVERMDPGLPAGLDFARMPVNGCWARPSRALAEWASSTLSTLGALGVEGKSERVLLEPDHAELVQGAALAANRAILLAIEEAVSAPAPVCEAQSGDEGVDLAVSVTAIGEFGDAEAPVAAENRALAGRIVAALGGEQG